MKNLLLILSLSFVFACHTKEEQSQSGVNDPINIIYNDIDSSVVSLNAPKPAASVQVTAAPDTAVSCIDSTKIQADAVCTQEFKPVCGCDGKQYGNQCEAEKAGVIKYADGPCVAKKETKKEAPKATSKAKESKKDAKKKKKK